jgi:hypothetical protein
VGVRVRVGVGVRVRVGVAVGDRVTVAVAVGVRVGVGVRVDVAVGVALGARKAKERLGFCTSMAHSTMPRKPAATNARRIAPARLSRELRRTQESIYRSSISKSTMLASRR